MHAVICPIRSRWRRRHNGTPFWCDDKVARLLNGVAYYGCPRCGRGAIEERDAAGHPDTCPTRCVEDNHPGREHAVWVASESPA